MIDKSIILCYNAEYDIYGMSIEVNKILKAEGKMKAAVGIIKEVDKLGRIVIPKEIRERFGLTKSAEIIVTEQGVVLRNPQYKLVRVDEDAKKGQRT